MSYMSHTTRGLLYNVKIVMLCRVCDARSPVLSVRKTLDCLRRNSAHARPSVSAPRQFLINCKNILNGSIWLWLKMRMARISRWHPLNKREWKRKETDEMPRGWSGVGWISECKVCLHWSESLTPSNWRKASRAHARRTKKKERTAGAPYLIKPPWKKQKDAT